MNPVFPSARTTTLKIGRGRGVFNRQTSVFIFFNPCGTRPVSQPLYVHRKKKRWY